MHKVCNNCNNFDQWLFIQFLLFAMKVGLQRYRAVFFSFFILSISSAIVLCAHLWRENYISDESVGQWIFVPSSKSTPATGLDPSQGAGDSFPTVLKTDSVKGAWVYLKNAGIEIPKLTESQAHQGINWGLMDCGFHGPSYESRALGCDRPGQA